MKTVKFLLVALFMLSITNIIKAQDSKADMLTHTKNVKIKVYGECDMCQKRIERAASSVEGIKSASWDVDNKVLTLKYDIFKKEAVNNVQKKVMSIGHDTEMGRASEVAYNNLPSCCHYQRRPS